MSGKKCDQKGSYHLQASVVVERKILPKNMKTFFGKGAKIDTIIVDTGIFYALTEGIFQLYGLNIVTSLHYYLNKN